MQERTDQIEFRESITPSYSKIGETGRGSYRIGKKLGIRSERESGAV